jgi:hypothetical protein
MTIDPGLTQIGTRNSSLHKFATSRSFVPPAGPIFLTLEEVVERYRGPGQRRNPPQLAFDEDRSIVHQDWQGRSLSVGGA